MTDELVTVATKYPDRPPMSEPEWVHMDWIQYNANMLSELPQWRERLAEAADMARRLDENPLLDANCKMFQERCNERWVKVVPLFEEAKAHLLREVWIQFKHIRTPHDAEADPDAAVREWEQLRDYALDKLAKPPMPDAGDGADATEAVALTPNEQYFVDLLTEEGQTGPDLAAKLARQGITTIGESEISKMAKRQSLMARGVRHRKGAGYYRIQDNAKATPR